MGRLLEEKAESGKLKAERIGFPLSALRFPLNVQLFTTTRATVKSSAKDFQQFCNSMRHNKLAGAFSTQTRPASKEVAQSHLDFSPAGAEIRKPRPTAWITIRMSPQKP
jgi:hypothetical protein